MDTSASSTILRGEVTPSVRWQMNSVQVPKFHQEPPEICQKMH